MMIQFAVATILAWIARLLLGPEPCCWFWHSLSPKPELRNRIWGIGGVSCSELQRQHTGLQGQFLLLSLLAVSVLQQEPCKKFMLASYAQSILFWHEMCCMTLWIELSMQILPCTVHAQSNYIFHIWSQKKKICIFHIDLFCNLSYNIILYLFLQAKFILRCM